MPKTKIKKENDFTKGLLCAVNLNDCFTWNEQTKQGFLGGQKITEAQKRSLQEEAKSIERTLLWQVMTNTLGDIARKVMFEKSESFEDMRWGKAILYAVDLQKKIIEAVKESK